MSDRQDSKPFVAAICQMSSTDDVDENLECARDLLSMAARQGARLACLPELFTCMSAGIEAKQKAADRNDGQVLRTLSSLAREFDMHISAGSIPVRGKSKLINRSQMYDNTGKIVGSYDKIHLFRYKGPDRQYDESLEYEAGSDVVCADTALGKIGMSICYDLRFPELYRNMDRPDIITVPSAFTRSTGEAHWELLVRSKAIENQCYVIAAAQCGRHPGGIETWGHSLMVDPWGKVIADLTEKPGVAVAMIDPGMIVSCRRRLPALDNRIL